MIVSWSVVCKWGIIVVVGIDSLLRCDDDVEVNRCCCDFCSIRYDFISV